MKSLYAILFLSILTMGNYACRQGPEVPPLPADKMSRILLDMHLAETYSQGLGDSVKNKFEKNYDSLGGFYVSVLKHYGLSFKEFDDALEWYKDRPVLLDSVYSIVLNQFNEIKVKEGIKDIEDPKNKKDSTASATDTAGLKRDTSGNKLLMAGDTSRMNSKDIAFPKKAGALKADTSGKNRKDTVLRKKVVKPTLKAKQ